MKVTHLSLTNWRNFKNASVDLADRTFIVGPNASGKSNFLEVFRFLRDLAKDGGGLQKAVKERGGLSKIRCLAARKSAQVEISIHMESDDGFCWEYELGIQQQSRGHRQLLVSKERVVKDGEVLLSRPDDTDLSDELLLTQTHLEQITANKEFRPICEFFSKILYLHLVPQLLKFPSHLQLESGVDDPFGVKFLQRIADTSEKTRRSRLRKIEEALRLSVPELKGLVDVRDEKGIPHLEATYEHWRPDAGKQREDQFSDGTLRLIGLLWSLLDGDSLLLLEEPELSLHAAIVQRLAPLIWRLQKTRKRQVIISTHSADLLRDQGIRGEEVLYLQTKGSEGTEIHPAYHKTEIRQLLEAGMSAADAVLPHTEPRNITQLSLFDS